MSKYWLPGIANEYVFASVDEARETLEANHGGLASGMLANLVEIEETAVAALLDDANVECQGREWPSTILNLYPGTLSLRVGPDDLSAAVRREIRRVLRLSPDRWSRWYYTDPIGNASLLCWTREED